MSQIINVNLQFIKSLTRRNITNKIVIHHSASSITTTIYDIHKWHLNNGWSGIGYHYVIYSNGNIYQGRPDNMFGAHAYQDSNHEANSNGIGICLIGNFETNKPTESQMNSLIWLIQDIQSRYGKLDIYGHKDIMPTACPGKNFPWQYLFDSLTLREVVNMLFSDVNPDRWSYSSIERLNKLGLIGGYPDGSFRPTQPLSREEFVYVLDKLLKLFGK